jgi:hypothetical protein
MKMQVISYFSPNYATHAAKLAESCKRWSIVPQDVTIQPVKAFKNWHQGVSFKPTFIRNTLEMLHQVDGVLWVDADGYFVRRPHFDDIKGDVGGCRFQWSPNHKVELLTGTLFFRNNNRVKALLDEWIKATKKYSYSDTPEQDALLEMVGAWRHTVAFEPLPIEWAYIDDPMVKEQYPQAIPVIMHSQASRQIRAEEFRLDQIKKSQEK